VIGMKKEEKSGKHRMINVFAIRKAYFS
jgi:hypothetical protein